jgi:hypothetical protein
LRDVRNEITHFKWSEWRDELNTCEVHETESHTHSEEERETPDPFPYSLSTSDINLVTFKQVVPIVVPTSGSNKLYWYLQCYIQLGDIRILSGDLVVRMIDCKDISYYLKGKVDQTAYFFSAKSQWGLLN